MKKSLKRSLSSQSVSCLLSNLLTLPKLLPAPVISRCARNLSGIAALAERALPLQGDRDDRAERFLEVAT
jgi:hypothetical protein